MKKFERFLLAALLLTACGTGTNGTQLEKVQNERNEVVNVQSMVKEINTGDVLIASVARLFSSDKYLLIADFKGYDKLIHLFDNENYRHVCSVGELGQGPYEITNMGTIAVDDARNKFYVSDHGKMKIFSYDMDSLFDSLKRYLEKTNRRITIEYIMLDGINDSSECANELCDLVKGLNCYINLIPYNETNNLGYKRSKKDTISKFYDIIKKRKINVTIRREFGSNISAACGQLRSKKEEL